ILIASILKGDDLHESVRDLAAKFVATGMHPGAAVNSLRALMENSSAPKDDRWQLRFDDIQRAVETAFDKYAPEEEEPEKEEQPETTPPPGAGASQQPQTPPPGTSSQSQQGPQQQSPGGGTQQAPGAGQTPGGSSQQTPGGGTQQARGAGTSSRPPQFKLHAFDAITLSTKPNYRVKGFIPDVGLVVVWGPPKCGKSFWMFDLMMHVALGWEYRSHKVKQGPVVYCAVEGGRNFRKRIQAWRLHYAARFRGPVPFWLIDLPINLIKDHKALIADIRLQTAGVVPSAVVIDTLNRSLYGSETDDED